MGVTKGDKNHSNRNCNKRTQINKIIKYNINKMNLYSEECNYILFIDQDRHVFNSIQLNSSILDFNYSSLFMAVLF